MAENWLDCEDEYVLLQNDLSDYRQSSNGSEYSSGPDGPGSTKFGPNKTFAGPDKIEDLSCSFDQWGQPQVALQGQATPF